MQDYVKKFEGKLLVHCAFCFFKDIGFDQKKFMQGFNKPDPQTSEGWEMKKKMGENWEGVEVIIKRPKPVKKPPSGS